MEHSEIIEQVSGILAALSAALRHPDAALSEAAVIGAVKAALTILEQGRQGK